LSDSSWWPLSFERWTDLSHSRDLPRSVGDVFTVIELRLNEEGKGEGKLAAATGSPPTGRGER
jgi:hypothetical protein